MAIFAFPPHSQADENGLLAWGGDLEVESLLLAYSQGIFPWPLASHLPMAWFTPNLRGILEHNDLHLSQSLKKFMNKKCYEVTFNSSFAQVIHHCAISKNRKQIGANNFSTWITPDMIDAYLQLHHAGYAYSVEVWEKKDLVGGLYGVGIGNFINGESMFYLKPNASKIALISVLEKAKNHGVEWIDIQMVTPTLKHLGGKEVSRDDFLLKLQTALKIGLKPSLFHRFAES